MKHIHLQGPNALPSTFYCTGCNWGKGQELAFCGDYQQQDMPADKTNLQHLSAVIPVTDDPKGSEVQPLAGAKRRMLFVEIICSKAHHGCRS